MSKLGEYISKEKEKYGSIYSDITYAINEIEPFIDSKILRQRKYTTHLPILSKYMSLIDSVEADSGKEKFLGFLKDDKSINVLEEYKNEHYGDIIQLEKCHKCECLNCPKECSFDTCLGCREGSKVVSCDHNKMCTVFFDNFVIPLNNDSTDEVNDYEVLAVVQDVSIDKRYILLDGVDIDNKLVLYYYPGISSTTYGEITNEQEFDNVISIYQSIEKE